MKLCPFSTPFPQLSAAGFGGGGDKQQAKRRAPLRRSWKSASLPPGRGVHDLRFPKRVLLKVRRGVPRRKMLFQFGNTRAARPSASPDAARLASAVGDSTFPPYLFILLYIGTGPVFTSSGNTHNVCRFSVGVGTYLAAVKRAGGNRRETTFGECLSVEPTERTSSENLQREPFEWGSCDLGRSWPISGGAVENKVHRVSWEETRRGEPCAAEFSLFPMVLVQR